jgi:zinc-binding alcohol dehydrogenase/oxidoreductase
MDRAGTSFAQVEILQGLYPGLKFPCILGSDGAGVVVDVFDNEDKYLISQPCSQYLGVGLAR